MVIPLTIAELAATQSSVLAPPLDRLPFVLRLYVLAPDHRRLQRVLRPVFAQALNLQLSVLRLVFAQALNLQLSVLRPRFAQAHVHQQSVPAHDHQQFVQAHVRQQVSQAHAPLRRAHRPLFARARALHLPLLPRPRPIPARRLRMSHHRLILACPSPRPFRQPSHLRLPLALLLQAQL